MPRNHGEPSYKRSRTLSLGAHRPAPAVRRPEARRQLPSLETLEGRRLLDASTPNPLVTEFPLPAPNSNPAQITNGPNGEVWFTETAANQIGRINPAGVLNEIPLPNLGSNPVGIT